MAQPASVLSGDELTLALAPTIGETLSGTPGVQSTFFGPAASRPIIRGLGGDRVRVLTDGLANLDASGLSEDHAVAIDPALATRSKSCAVRRRCCTAAARPADSSTW